MSRLYTPPAGYYDLPFTWAFDASALTDGKSYPNQYVFLQGGYGDFLLRRIVGLSRVLDPSTGTYLIRDASSNPMQQVPIFGASADDVGLPHEQLYPELGEIKFDLGTILRPASQPLTAQIAFQGVRRMKGARAHRPDYPATSKSFTYLVTGPITSVAGGPPNRVTQTIDNYDFELYNIIIVQQTNASLQIVEPS